MMMETTHYLPSEELKTANYPELLKVRDMLREIEAFSGKLSTSLNDYYNAKSTRISANLAEVSSYIDMCRDVCATLGRASNVCYDVLLEVREHQRNFQEILFIGRQYGDTYIVTTVAEANESLPGVSIYGG